LPPAAYFSFCLFVYQGVSWLNNSQPGFLGVLKLNLCPGSQVGKRGKGTGPHPGHVGLGLLARPPAGNQALVPGGIRQDSQPGIAWRVRKKDVGWGKKP
jgi:hypothetical protein